MEFDSHTSDVVGNAVALINDVTPGERHGKPFPAPADLRIAVRDAVPPSRTPDHPTETEAAELAGWAARLRAVVELVDDGEVDTACTTLNRILRETEAMPTLVRHDGEPWHLHFHSAGAEWAISWAASMATALAVVLGNASIERLGICNATACDRVYVDISRNGTRRFCSTACQNRVKAAAFRARKTAG
ncbi:CGNR zinc finger domain-containing protein [Actinophytocola gossypii]|uniref:CGNR zinc finger domain-containing protein n=1 Tax=Actinophytocola gossypii TaxID=2812003 RepID=UPI0021A2D9B9|nr:CGNR zinc finger domain-containing protein [Actinophytocola gossypii]